MGGFVSNGKTDVWTKRREHYILPPRDIRKPYDVDYARIVHSASFRRLQGKTQILNLGDSDFYRTRLTHSLEVAQIAGGLVAHLRENAAAEVKALLPDHNLIQAIGFTHDLGHPPFGHGGEIALNYCMRDCGGFEGNGQTLRILSSLEKYHPTFGANLTRRTMLGVLKYPVVWENVRNPEIIPALQAEPQSIAILDRDASKPPKCYMGSEQQVVDWILEPLATVDRDLFGRFTVREPKNGKPRHSEPNHKSFDCSIMDLADDIAFGIHDLEDALALRLITTDDFEHYVSEDDAAPYLNLVASMAPSENNQYAVVVRNLFGGGETRKRYISKMVSLMVTHCEVYVADESFQEPLLRYRVRLPDAPRRFLDALGQLVRERVIQSAEVQHLEFKGQKMVVAVFEALASEPERFLPFDTRKLYDASGKDIRVICDHVAGMTDNFLLKTYDRLFSPRMGSVFDKL